MSLTNDGMGAADIAAITRGNDGYGFGGDGAWWLLVLFLFAFNGNWGWGNGNGGNGGGTGYVVSDVQRGFDQSAIMGGLSGIQSAVTNGFVDTAASLCNGFAGVNSAISNGFAQAEIANNARQIADLQQSFALQSQFADCCCENRLASADLKYTIATENCADRAAVSDGIRDVIAAQAANTQSLINSTNAGIQSVMDKICQLELDAKNDKIAELQRQLSAAQGAASQNAQTAAILADNAAQTAMLRQSLNPTAIPAYIVQNPNCCSNMGTAYGCCNG